MTQPIELDIPHQLGKEAAHARVENGFKGIADLIPGGRVTQHRWTGDTLEFTVEGMGQRIATRLEVFADKVHAAVDLPPLLSLFAEPLRAKLAKEAPKMLE